MDSSCARDTHDSCQLFPGVPHAVEKWLKVLVKAPVEAVQFTARPYKKNRL